MSYISNPISGDQDSKWNEPDPKIKYLHEQIIMLKDKVQALESNMFNTVKNLNGLTDVNVRQQEIISTQGTQLVMLSVFAAGQMSQEEIKAILRM